MGKITLYGADASPPVRAVLLTLKALNLPFEYIVVDMINKVHLSKEYLAKNPQHTIPTLEDDGHFIWDSHVIMSYLVSKYGKDDSLYPKDFYKRAVVDQRLHFESGVVFAAGVRNIATPIFALNEKNVSQSKINHVIDIYNFLETFLDQNYIAGDQLTIADFSIISSVSSLVAFVPLDASKYPKVTAWVKRLEQLPYYQEANGKGAQQFIGFMKSANFQIVE